MTDSSTARSKLEFLQKEFLGDVHQLVEKLENIAGQVSAAVEQLKVVPDDNKKALTSVAVALVRAVRELEASGQPGSRYANLVGLNDDGVRAVRRTVDEAVANWKPDLVPAIHEAERHGPTASTLHEVKTEVQKLARAQTALGQQLQATEGMDWRRVGLAAAACFLAAAMGTGAAMLAANSWIESKRQDLTLKQASPGTPTGEKISAAHPESR